MAKLDSLSEKLELDGAIPKIIILVSHFNVTAGGEMLNAVG